MTRVSDVCLTSDFLQSGKMETFKDDPVEKEIKYNVVPPSEKNKQTVYHIWLNKNWIGATTNIYRVVGLEKSGHLITFMNTNFRPKGYYTRAHKSRGDLNDVTYGSSKAKIQKILTLMKYNFTQFVRDILHSFAATSNTLHSAELTDNEKYKLKAIGIDMEDNRCTQKLVDWYHSKTNNLCFALGIDDDEIFYLNEKDGHSFFYSWSEFDQFELNNGTTEPNTISELVQCLSVANPHWLLEMYILHDRWEDSSRSHPNEDFDYPAVSSDERQKILSSLYAEFGIV